MKAASALHVTMGHHAYLWRAVAIPETKAAHELRGVSQCVQESPQRPRGLDRTSAFTWPLKEQMNAKTVNKQIKGGRQVNKSVHPHEKHIRSTGRMRTQVNTRTARS